MCAHPSSNLPINQSTTQINAQGPESEFFAKLAVDAVLSVRAESDHAEAGKKTGKYPVRCVGAVGGYGVYVGGGSLSLSLAFSLSLSQTPPNQPPISAIHILKCHGKSSLESHLVNGFALAGSRAAQGMPSAVKNAKIALLDFGLQRHKLQLGVQARCFIGQQSTIDGYMIHQ